jgi:hypothetical protein
MTYLLRLSACLLLCVSLNSFGAVVSLSQSELWNFEHINISSSGGVSLPVYQDENGLVFITFFFMADGMSSAAIGDVDAGFDWDQFDTYSQSIVNRDENPWFFSLSVKDSFNNIASSETIELAFEEGQIFSVDLSGLASRNPINEVYVTISADLPLPANDSVAEYQISFGVSEVPLPAGIYLFLSGLLGLGLMRGRMISKEEQK